MASVIHDISGLHGKLRDHLSQMDDQDNDKTYLDSVMETLETIQQRLFINSGIDMLSIDSIHGDIHALNGARRDIERMTPEICKLISKAKNKLDALEGQLDASISEFSSSISTIMDEATNVGQLIRNVT
jgi:hypothetical protein